MRNRFASGAIRRTALTLTRLPEYRERGTSEKGGLKPVLPPETMVTPDNSECGFYSLPFSLYSFAHDAPHI